MLKIYARILEINDGWSLDKIVEVKKTTVFVRF